MQSWYAFMVVESGHLWCNSFSWNPTSYLQYPFYLIMFRVPFFSVMWRQSPRHIYKYNFINMHFKLSYKHSGQPWVEMYWCQLFNCRNYRKRLLLITNYYVNSGLQHSIATGLSPRLTQGVSHWKSPDGSRPKYRFEIKNGPDRSTSCNRMIFIVNSYNITIVHIQYIKRTIGIFSGFL